MTNLSESKLYFEHTQQNESAELTSQEKLLGEFDKKAEAALIDNLLYLTDRIKPEATKLVFFVDTSSIAMDPWMPTLARLKLKVEQQTGKSVTIQPFTHESDMTAPAEQQNYIITDGSAEFWGSQEHLRWLVAQQAQNVITIDMLGTVLRRSRPFGEHFTIQSHPGATFEEASSAYLKAPENWFVSPRVPGSDEPLFTEPGVEHVFFPGFSYGPDKIPAGELSVMHTELIDSDTVDNMANTDNQTVDDQRVKETPTDWFRSQLDSLARIPAASLFICQMAAFPPCTLDELFALQQEMQGTISPTIISICLSEGLLKKNEQGNYDFIEGTRRIAASRVRRDTNADVARVWIKLNAGNPVFSGLLEIIDGNSETGSEHTNSELPTISEEERSQLKVLKEVFDGFYTYTSNEHYLKYMGALLLEE